MTITPPNRLLHRDQAVLLVVDIQEKFIDTIEDAERLVKNTGILLTTAQELGLPIVVSEQYPKGLGHTVPELLEKLLPGTPVLEKTAFGCLGDAGITQHLASLGRKQVIICGLETHVCINQTVHQLLAAGYEPHVVQDALASRNKRNYKTAMAKMLQSGATPTCVEMAMFELMQSSTCSSFKTLQALIK